jgi:hypothetical protein
VMAVFVVRGVVVVEGMVVVVVGMVVVGGMVAVEGGTVVVGGMVVFGKVGTVAGGREDTARHKGIGQGALSRMRIAPLVAYSSFVPQVRDS